MLKRLPRYSLGIRQQLLGLFEHRERDGVVVSDQHSKDFLREMLSSTFCGSEPRETVAERRRPALLRLGPIRS